MTQIDLSTKTHYSDFSLGGPIGNMYDGNLATYIQNLSYLAVDLGVSNDIIVSDINIAVHNSTARGNLLGGTVRGSNDSTNGLDGTWDLLLTITSGIYGTPSSYPGFGNLMDLGNTTLYRWIKVDTLPKENNTVLNEWELYGSLAPVETPVILPTSGEYPPSQLISMTCATSGADIYYTEDGSTPDSSDTLYTVPFTLTSAKTIKAIGIKSGIDDSDIATESYTLLTVKTPDADPSAGSYNFLQKITLSTLTSGADIYYTLDGTTPTSASTLYVSPIPIFDGVLKAFGVKTGYIDSPIESVLYNKVDFDPYCVDPEFQPYIDCESCPTFDPNDPFDLSTVTNPYFDCTSTLEDGCFPEPSPLPAGKWVAALEQRGTDYIYFYDITNFAVIKVDTSGTNPVVVDYLVINDAEYDLDYEQGYGNVTNSQRGSYCISKASYTKIWYLFRNNSNGNLKLVEIDLKFARMIITNTSLHSAIVPGEHFHDAVANDDYAFFPTSKISGRILRFDTNHTLLDKEFNYSATGSGDEAIASITLNPILNEISWVYVRIVPFATAHIPYSSFDFIIRTTASHTEGGSDSAIWQNFLRYDELYDYLFLQRAYLPTNGVARAVSDWEIYLGYPSMYIQNLRYMQNLLGGNSPYYYILQMGAAANSWNLHRLERSETSGGGIIPSTSISVTSYVDRFSTKSTVSVYNEKNDKSFLSIYNSSEGKNYLASFDNSLTLVSDIALDTINWGE